MIPTYPPAEARAPFKGQPLFIPGTIQIEDYDDGPQGNAYSPLSSTASTFNPNLNDYGNNAWGSGRYRLESPFYIWGTITNGVRQYVMDVSPASAWLEYTVDVVQAGTYNLAFAYSYLNGAFHLELDGTRITPSLTATNSTATVGLPQGTHVLRLVNEITAANRLDYISFQQAP